MGMKLLFTSHETSSFSIIITSAKLIIFNSVKLSMKLILWPTLLQNKYLLAIFSLANFYISCESRIILFMKSFKETCMSSLLVILKVLKMILSLGPTRQRGSMHAAPTIHVGWMCQRRELPATPRHPSYSMPSRLPSRVVSGAAAAAVDGNAPPRSTPGWLALMVPDEVQVATDLRSWASRARAIRLFPALEVPAPPQSDQSHNKDTLGRARQNSRS